MDNSKRDQEGYTLSWSNLSYTIPSGRKILSDLNGIVYPGSVTAVLGASGAGKSTFLDTLSGRVPSSHVSGEVEINGSVNKIPIRHVSRYCTQEDALYGSLTVWETLIYAAQFNMTASLPRKEKIAAVERMITEFGLEEVRKTIIGSPLRKGCSGGQVRRVSVAAQVIGLKSGILFLDEPTSGLDSVAAYAIISAVKNLAKRQNSTVIATIHQPSTETFELFSNILLLGQGSTVYFGDRAEAIHYFESVGYPVPLRSNPSDKYLQLTNTDFDSQDDGKEQVAYLVKAFAESEGNSNLLKEIEVQKLSEKREGIPTSAHTYANGFFHQTWTLASRAFLNAAKNPLAYWIRVAMYLALAVLMGTTWVRLGTDQSTVQDRMAGLFFGLAFLSFMSVAGIPAFLEERHVFMREIANGLYGVESYFLSNTLVSFPFILIFAVGFSSAAYFWVGFQASFVKFGTYLGVLFLSLLIAEAQTVFVSVAIPIFVASLAVNAFVTGLWMVTQGFFVQKKSLPWFWRNTFHQINYQKYAYELLVDNEFRGLNFTCAMDEDCQCSFPRSGDTCSFSGKDVLHYYKYDEIEQGTWVIILLAIFAASKLATYVFLKIRMRRNS